MRKKKKTSKVHYDFPRKVLSLKKKKITHF